MKYAVIGLGQFGKAAATGLARHGMEVIAVDLNMDEVNAVKDEVSLAVRMDASNMEALQSHGLDEVDGLIASIGDNFEAQVLVVVHAKRLQIKRVLARASTPDHARVLEAVGADEVFNPEQEAARSMVQRLTISNISSYYELAEGFSVVEVKAPKQLAGKTLKELDLRRSYRINLVALKRMKTEPDGTKVLQQFNPVPLPDELILEGDILALVGSVLDLAKFTSEFEEN
jgi:trk/ktr system potassium uptake protein